MTFAEMQTSVLTTLIIAAGATAKVTQAGHFINQERSRVAVKYELDVNTDDLAVTANDPIVALPATFAAIRHLSFNGNTVQQLTPFVLARRAAARELSVGASDGPSGFTFEGVNTIRIEPPFEETAADSGLVLNYVARPAALTGTQTPAELPEEFHQLLVEYAVMRMAVGEDERAVASEARAEHTRLLAELELHISRRKGGHDTRIIRRHYG